ncbi:hypothetical protein [Sorangium sp. So ce1151]|uniref:hypothetical protein n=1 Tax=Sorangium sp. So ce1151 TaxID=3133332 RepID=UPI003F628E12
MADYASLAQAVVTLLAPHLAALMTKVTGSIAEKTADAAWNKAGSIWDKVKGLFGHGTEVQGAATLVQNQPNEPQYREILSKVLAKRLESEPALAGELAAILGGQEGVNRILAEGGSTIRNVEQDNRGSGTNTVEARNQSVIEGILQRHR